MKSAHRSIVRNGLLAASAMAAVGLLSAAASAQSYGTIKGRLVWGGSDVPKPAVLVKQGDQSKKDVDVCTKAGELLSRDLIVDAKSKGIENGVAFLVKPKGANPEAVKALVAKEAKVQLDQKNCEFIPHVVVAIKDQPLVFKSSDPVSHNVHYSGFSNQNNIALPPNGQFQAKMTAENVRPIPLVCDIHPWMSGKIFVFDHPFFAVTKADGSFEIHGVPAGEQNVIVWHEKVGFATPGKNKGKPVTVKANETADIGDVTIDPSNLK